ncbi:NAD(P)/FAD-dependent oxidoreductase [bacterium SCSIO 12741]|nr:NAD(P)/FAD-dependent oxidoreductase [bacterium SCSIO 12741]
MQVVVIGGGAAGFFAAISCRQHHPDAHIRILEKSTKLLSKVRISGGGRCNVTHACFNQKELAAHYPRGERFLRKSFSKFFTQDTVDWYESRGVLLKTESDGRMFPQSNRSETIVDCLMSEAEKGGIRIDLNSPVKALTPKNDKILLTLGNDESLEVDQVIIATGGSPKKEGLHWLEKLGIPIQNPVPSLFTFNLPGQAITSLMGLSVPDAWVRISGSKLSSSGPLLITHWGVSGPGVLKLSALGARELADRNYQFNALISWVGSIREDDLRQQLSSFKQENPSKKLHRQPLGLPKRLWSYLLDRIDLREDENWGDLSRKKMNRLVNLLLNDEYEVRGKTTFKEEFVTCGGVDLKSVSPFTLESKTVPNLYFAGEVLDIDGVTGGFNFQAAWTTGFLAGKLQGKNDPEK